MKILLLQPYSTRVFPSSTLLKINKAITFLLKKFFFWKDIITPTQIRGVNWLDRVLSLFPTEIIITSEFNHYGDLFKNPKIDLYAIDKIHPSYFTKTPFKIYGVDWEKYPSSFGFEKPKFISKKNANKNIKDFDAIICSIKAGKELYKIAKNAKKNNIKVFLFDNIDHENIYLNPKEDIYRGFSDFDFIFKKDVPLNLNNNLIIPIAPVPCKSLLIKDNSRNNLKNSTSIFFVGRHRSGLTREDRIELLKLLKDSFDDSNILINKKPISSIEYDNFSSKSKILVSPAGRVWCSFRHTELAQYPGLVIIPKPNCEIYGPQFTHLEDSFLYESEIVNGVYRVKNIEKLIKDLNLVLENDDLRLKIVQNYKKKILKYHTTESRSDFLIGSIKTRIK